MTVEDLHDALTLLPADLVAEADKRRSRKPQVLLWHRWTAMAACLVLILSCGLLVQSRKAKLSASEMSLMADQAAPMEGPQAAMGQGESQAGSTERAPEVRSSAVMDQSSFPAGIEDIRWVETPAESSSAVNMRSVTLIRDSEMLETYLSSFTDETAATLRESTTGYDDGWFALHDLLLIRLSCPSGSTIGTVRKTDEQWEIHLQPSRLSLLGYYHILVDVEKGSIESADHVTISCDEP